MQKIRHSLLYHRLSDLFRGSKTKFWANPVIGHVSSISTMQCFIGISRNTQLKSNTCILLLTECVWESQSTALFINRPFLWKKWLHFRCTLKKFGYKRLCIVVSLKSFSWRLYRPLFTPFTLSHAAMIQRDEKIKHNAEIPPCVFRGKNLWPAQTLTARVISRDIA